MTKEPRAGAWIFLGLAIGWAILAAFQAGYLRDLAVQAAGIGAYLPGWLQALAELPPRPFAVIAALNALLALVDARGLGGRPVAAALAPLRVLGAAGALAYVAAALALLYYVSLAPTGM